MVGCWLITSLLNNAGLEISGLFHDQDMVRVPEADSN